MTLRILLASLIATCLLVSGASGQSLGGPPVWHPLPKEHQDYLDQVLKYWEYQTSQIKQYRCQFTWWVYDRTVLPRDPEIATSVSKGNIQFASPDKGLFKVEQRWEVLLQQNPELKTNAPVIKDNKPQYSPQKDNPGEHWICDGTAVYEFHAESKQLVKIMLPPEMQGLQIAEGPLPFIFGAKAQSIKDRYWIRVKSPPPKPDHFWLEAYPKRREDAANFRLIEIILDQKEFLPTALLLHEPAGGRSTFEFAQREKNWIKLPEMIAPWLKQNFWAPKTPPEWKLVVRPYQGVVEPSTPAPSQAPPRPDPNQRQAQGKASQPAGVNRR